MKKITIKMQVPQIQISLQIFPAFSIPTFSYSSSFPSISSNPRFDNTIPIIARIIPPPTRDNIPKIIDGIEYGAFFLSITKIFNVPVSGFEPENILSACCSP